VDHGADAQMSILAGGVAHDLNTVLTTIFGYCEMALESLSDSRETEKNIRRIISSAGKAKTLTAQLLDMSRRVSMEMITVRVDDVLDDTLDFIRPSVPENIRISRYIKVAGATVMAVPVQLFRVFLNLILNAIQAMRENGGTLEVTVDVIKGNDDQTGNGKERSVFIRFTDTGNGMDEATAAKIFRPFFTSDSEKGTGLGLTVVDDAVREMGGRIEIISSPGSGTTINLIIPAAFFGTVPEKH